MIFSIRAYLVLWTRPLGAVDVFGCQVSHHNLDSPFVTCLTLESSEHDTHFSVHKESSPAGVPHQFLHGVHLLRIRRAKDGNGRVERKADADSEPER